MELEANRLGGLTSISSLGGKAFSVVLLLVTILPAIAFVTNPYIPSITPMVAFIVILASTHVFATFYLLTDRGIREYMYRYPVRMIVMPLAFVLLGVVMFSSPGNPLFVLGILALLLFQTWHFGSQNIGVATFASFVDRKRPLSRFEKIAIRLGICCGMLGVLHTLYPSFMIGQEYMPVPSSLLLFFAWLHKIGSIVAIVFTAMAATLLIKAWRNGHFLYGLSIFFSVTFFFTMYLSNNYMVAFASFAVAHGLQYLVFLSAHSLSKASNTSFTRAFKPGILLAPLLFVAIVALGRFVWISAPAIKQAQFELFGASILLGLTLAHFWVDRYLWRMKDKDRAQWMKEHFRFVFQR